MSAAHDEELVEAMRHTVRRFMSIVDHLPTGVSAMALLYSEDPDWLEKSKSHGAVELWHSHDRLVEMMAEAKRLTDGDGNAEKLQAIARRFIGFVNGMPPRHAVDALLDAEKPEWRDGTWDQAMDAEVNEGYRMVSRLMTEAYRLTDRGGAFSE